MLMRIHPDASIEPEIRNLELPVAFGNENVDPLDELHDFLPIEIARELIELALIRLAVPPPPAFALLAPAFQTPDIGPRPAPWSPRAEPAAPHRHPLIEEPLDPLPS